jgi:hypothetical protein
MFDCHSRKFSSADLVEISDHSLSIKHIQLYHTSTHRVARRTTSRIQQEHPVCCYIVSKATPENSPWFPIQHLRPTFFKMSVASSSSSVRNLLGSRSQTLASIRCARTKVQRAEGEIPAIGGVRYANSQDLTADMQQLQLSKHVKRPTFLLSSPNNPQCPVYVHSQYRPILQSPPP